MARRGADQPPYPPLAPGEVVDLRHEAPPPPGLASQAFTRNGSEVWVHVDVTAADTPDRPLQLIDGEPVPLGLRRVAVSQLDTAVAALRQSDVTEARVSLARVRSVVRAVRTWIGEDVYRSEDAVLAGVLDRMDGPDRTAARLAAAQTVAPGTLEDRATAGLLDSLRSEHRRAMTRSVGDAQIRTDLVTTVATCRTRFAAWPVHDGVVPHARRVKVPDAFSAIAGGLEDGYARGREGLEGSLEFPDAETLWQWRIAGEHLGFQLELMAGAWPEVLGAMIDTLDVLDQELTLERRLGDLAWRVTTPPWPLPGVADQHALALEAELRREEAMRRALALGRRLYAETPDAFIGRMASYWAAWRSER